jgi:hypothetical protein
MWQLELLPDDAVDLTVNFDSLVEMPRATVELYLRHTARVSRAFYTVNHRGPTAQGSAPWRALREFVDEFFLRRVGEPFRLLHEGPSREHPQPQEPLSLHVALLKKFGQLFVQRSPRPPQSPHAVDGAPCAMALWE